MIVNDGETGDWYCKGNVPQAYWKSLQFTSDFIAGLEALNYKLLSASGYEGEGRTFIFRRYKK